MLVDMKSPKINLITKVEDDFDASCLLCSSCFGNLNQIDRFLDLSCFEQLQLQSLSFN